MFFHIHIYCRKFVTEFNKLIKTECQHARVFFFRKMILNTTTFPNNIDFIWIFSYSHLSSP